MVKLRQERVRPFTRAYQDVKGLYHDAFPPEERPPYWLATLFALQPQIAFTAYYAGDTFVGFTYTVTTSETTFLFLFAVADSVRSQGYGTQILGEIAEQSRGKAQVLCIEPMDETAPNYAQRLKRLDFYQKNGYRRQYRDFHELAEVYEILATSDSIDYPNLQKELNRASLGLLQIKISSKGKKQPCLKS